MSETELVERLRHKDPAACKLLVDRYADQVFNTALGLLQHHSDAEDLTQEVFAYAFQFVGAFRMESKLSTWLYRIATTRALDLLRSRKSKKRFGFMQKLFGDGNEPLHEIPDFNHPGVAMDRKENAAKLFRAIAQLPDNQKTAFTLHKLEDLSYQEISEIMQTSVPAVESLMHRAKQNLRKILEKETD